MLLLISVTVPAQSKKVRTTSMRRSLKLPEQCCCNTLKTLKNSDKTYPSSWALACLSSRWPWPCHPHLQQEACSDGPWCLWRRWCTGSWHLMRKNRQGSLISTKHQIYKKSGCIKELCKRVPSRIEIEQYRIITAISPKSNGVHFLLPRQLTQPLSRRSKCF